MDRTAGWNSGESGRDDDGEVVPWSGVVSCSGGGARRTTGAATCGAGAGSSCGVRIRVASGASGGASGGCSTEADGVSGAGDDGDSGVGGGAGGHGTPWIGGDLGSDGALGMSAEQGGTAVSRAGGGSCGLPREGDEVMTAGVWSAPGLGFPMQQPISLRSREEVKVQVQVLVVVMGVVKPAMEVVGAAVVAGAAAGFAMMGVAATAVVPMMWLMVGTGQCWRW